MLITSSSSVAIGVIADTFHKCIAERDVWKFLGPLQGHHVGPLWPSVYFINQTAGHKVRVLQYQLLTELTKSRVPGRQGASCKAKFRFIMFLVVSLRPALWKFPHQQTPVA